MVYEPILEIPCFNHLTKVLRDINNDKINSTYPDSNGENDSTIMLVLQQAPSIKIFVHKNLGFTK